MKPSARKTKGKTFESKIAVLIQKRLLEIHQYKQLWDQVGNKKLAPSRDTSSGTFKNSDSDIDLGLARNFFPFSVECKDWKTLDLSINSILKGQILSLEKIWNDQVIPASEKSGLKPIIVFKSNRTSTFVMHNQPNIKTNNFCSVKGWTICLFDDFLDYYIDNFDK